MRLLVCDFSGHPFQVQLSRELARRGHDVVHAFCPDYRSGQGDLSSRTTDPHTFSLKPLPLGTSFEKSRYIRRAVHELRFGWALCRLLQQTRPDAFVSCNEPLLAKLFAGLWCRLRKQRWVFWLQDLYAVAMQRELEAKGRIPGRIVGEALIRLEAWLLASADDVVAISSAFTDWMWERRVHQQRATVIPNWAPLDELPYYDKNPGWFATVGLPDEVPVVLYSGTLGRKHNADTMVGIAQGIQDFGAHVVVISEGQPAQHLAHRAEAMSNLHVLPFRPWSEFPIVLASAAVLVVLLEPAAGLFSVPSKVLTYMCAGRAIVGAMPEDNLAAQVIASSGAGIVVPPDDGEAITKAVAELIAHPSDRHQCGRAARAYAESHFQIEPIADRWEQRLHHVVSRN